MKLDNIDNIECLIPIDEYKFKHSKEQDNMILNGLMLSGIGDCNIIVDKEGGMTAHFEIHSIDGSFKTCIRINEPEYYFRDRTDFKKLNDTQIDDLIQFLNETNYGWRNYISISQMWLNLNNDKKYDNYNKAFIMPDYNRLKEDIYE